MYTLKNYREMLDFCLKAEEGNREAKRNDTPEVGNGLPEAGNKLPVKGEESGNSVQKLENKAEEVRLKAENLKIPESEKSPLDGKGNEGQSIDENGNPESKEGNEGQSIKVGFQLNEDGNPVLDSETIQNMRNQFQNIEDGKGLPVEILIPKPKEGEEKQSYGLEEILPSDVASITIIDNDGKERTLTRKEGSLTGGFIDENDPNFKLDEIDSNTSVEISGIRTEKEIARLEQKANDTMKDFLEKHPEYEDNPDMKNLAMDLIRRSDLEGNPIDVNEMLPRVLTGDFSNYEGLSDGGAEMGRIVGGMQNRLDGSRGGGLGGKANLDVGSDGLPVGAEIPDGLKKLVKLAMGEIGITEKDGGADKYLGGKSSKQIPWCAAFANWCLQQSGLPGTGSLVAESFVGGGNPGKHVGMYIENNGSPCILGGNQSNEVRVSKVKPESIIGYYNPVGNPKISKPAQMPIPSGVFIVTGGGGGTR